MDRKELLELLNNTENNSEPIPNNPHDRVMLIDGLNLFFRNFAMINFLNKEGTHVGGLGGFIRSLNSLITTIKPTSVYVVFDGVGSSINRKNLLPEYKSGRNIVRITNWDSFDSLDEEHDAKVDQIIRLIHYLKCLPVKTVSLDKVEADDVIAYLSNILSNKHNSQVYIVSNDKDFIQLTTNKITVYRPTEKDFYSKDLIKQNFGVLAENFILYKTLLGDASDKVPGIKGLGEKGLLKKFPELAERVCTLQDIYDISASKYKKHIVYARIIDEIERLENNYTIMDLSNPLMGEIEKVYIDELVLEPLPVLNVGGFMKLYNEDGLGHLIKNPEYVIKDTYKILNSFKNKYDP
jgi:5'-3' exonuclease